jgi:uncharacterized membrane protein YsdA (DUF1294 family)
MTLYQIIITSYIVLVNITAYGVMCYDKLLSKRNGWRVPENSLLALASFLGAVGIYLGMKAPLYHKAAKPKFRFGIPLLIIINGVIVYLLLKNSPPN